MRQCTPITRATGLRGTSTNHTTGTAAARANNCVRRADGFLPSIRHCHPPSLFLRHGSLELAQLAQTPVEVDETGRCRGSVSGQPARAHAARAIGDEPGHRLLACQCLRAAQQAAHILGAAQNGTCVAVGKALMRRRVPPEATHRAGRGRRQPRRRPRKRSSLRQHAAFTMSLYRQHRHGLTSACSVCVGGRKARTCATAHVQGACYRRC